MNRLDAFLADHPAVVAVRVAKVQGSAPREEGAEMLVAPDGFYGTIGGGQLEYMGIDTARLMLRDGKLTQELDVPLGPEIGQCCGGRVTLSLRFLDQAARGKLLAEAEKHRHPKVYIFGAGHVGRALAIALKPLPLHPILIDSRSEELALADAAVEQRRSPLPEAELKDAPAGSAVVILTHDHSLDFLIASEALKREDFAYVGMIGSATKRGTFANFLRREGRNPKGLTCPIGAAGLGDKRPEVIAAFVAAEVMEAVNAWQSEATGITPSLAQPSAT